MIKQKIRRSTSREKEEEDCTVTNVKTQMKQGLSQKCVRSSIRWVSRCFCDDIRGSYVPQATLSMLWRVMATRWVVRAEPQQGSPSFPLHSSAHEQNAHAISHHFLAPIFDPPICPFFFPSCLFFSLLFSCSHRKRVALQVAREKGKGITTPMRNGRCFHALVVWYWEKKEKTIEHVKDNQPSLLKYRPEEGFWELPSEKRKSLYAQSFGNKPEHRASSRQHL